MAVRRVGLVLFLETSSWPGTTLPKSSPPSSPLLLKSMSRGIVRKVTRRPAGADRRKSVRGVSTLLRAGGTTQKGNMRQTWQVVHGLETRRRAHVRLPAVMGSGDRGGGRGQEYVAQALFQVIFARVTVEQGRGARRGLHPVQPRFLAGREAAPFAQKARHGPSPAREPARSRRRRLRRVPLCAQDTAIVSAVLPTKDNLPETSSKKPQEGVLHVTGHGTMRVRDTPTEALAPFLLTSLFLTACSFCLVSFSLFSSLSILPFSPCLFSPSSWSLFISSCAQLPIPKTHKQTSHRPGQWPLPDRRRCPGNLLDLTHVLLRQVHELPALLLASRAPASMGSHRRSRQRGRKRRCLEISFPRATRTTTTTTTATIVLATAAVVPRHKLHWRHLGCRHALCPAHHQLFLLVFLGRCWSPTNAHRGAPIQRVASVSKKKTLTG